LLTNAPDRRPLCDGRARAQPLRAAYTVWVVRGGGRRQVLLSASAAQNCSFRGRGSRRGARRARSRRSRAVSAGALALHRTPHPPRLPRSVFDPEVPRPAARDPGQRQGAANSQ